MEDNYYLCLLEKNYVKFDPVSQITNVFFDDTKNQIFIVKSVSVSVKSIGLADQIESLSFSIDSAPIIAIKFNSDNSVLAIQRTETSLELAPFINNQLLPTSKIFYETKKTILYGFFWTQPNELVIVSADHVEVFQINTSKRSMKSLKSINVSSNWFVWNRSNLAVLTSNNGMVMTPLILQKSGSMTKLASIQIEDEPGVTERDVNTGILYGNPAILLLRTSKSRSLEIWVYLLDGPSFWKSHILKLGFSGRVAISIIDSLIIVHHQTLKISLVFDIGIASECDPHNKSVMIHSPIVPGKSIRPFTIKMPSVLKESALNVELYSANWVIFQPDIIIDVKLGYLFKLSLAIEKIQISDKLKHVDFLMNRQGAKPQLLSVLLETVTPNDCNELLHLPVLEALFDKINKVYKQKVDHDLLKIQALPSPSGFKSFSTAVASGSPQPPSKVVIEQSDILQLLNTIIDKDLMEKVLMVYIFSIVKNSISCEYELSKVLVITLVGSHKIQDLQQIISYNVLHESKPLACFLMSLANHDPLISQMAMDMLKRLNSHEIIVEILLEQGKVVDAMRLTKQYTNIDFISARKFLEAAWKSEDKMIFYSVFNFLTTRNQRLRGNSEFLKGEQCEHYVKLYSEMFTV